MNTRELGELGERLAENFLKKEGYKITDKNFWCQFGEIDLIAVDDNYIVFIEVKMLCSNIFSPQEQITARKRARIIKVANYYRVRFNLKSNYRFDVVSIQLKKGEPEFELIKNAFYA